MPPRPVERPEALLPRLDLAAHLADPAIKQRFVTTMFEVVARRYDQFTRVFSYGMDAGWKRELLEALGPTDQSKIRALDLACGTGDLAFGALGHLPAATVTGFDVAHRMVRAAEARRRAMGGERLRFAVADMAQLPAADRSVDLVTVGYGIRNAPEVATALAEIARVLRPGGRLLVLDFYRPRHVLWRTLFVGYLRLAGNLVGWLWHREPVAYGYIAASVERYVSGEEFSQHLRHSGFAVNVARRKLLGGIWLHVATLVRPA